MTYQTDDTKADAEYSYKKMKQTKAVEDGMKYLFNKKRVQYYIMDKHYMNISTIKKALQITDKSAIADEREKWISLIKRNKLVIINEKDREVVFKILKEGR